MAPLVGLLLAAAPTPPDTPVTSFELLYSGKVGGSIMVRIEGVMDTRGINFYSLDEPGGTAEPPRCIPLILTRSDQDRAKLRNGRKAVVRGRILLLGDLNTMVPARFGTINGRIWAGTPCLSEAAVYVTRLSFRK